MIWFNRGITLCDDLRKYEEALDSFDRVIQIKFDFERAWYCRGVALSHLERYEEAIITNNQAIEINPNYYKAWAGKGNALNNLGRYEESIASYDRAIKINPDDFKDWLNRGNVLNILGRYDDAIASYDRAIDINPNGEIAYFVRDCILQDLERHDEAIASYDRAIEINPDLSLTYPYCYSRGVALGNLERYEESIVYYDLAIKIEPNTYKSWCNKGIALKDLGRYKKAIVCFYQALKIQPTDHLTWSHQGDTLAIIHRNKNGYGVGISSYNEAFEHIHPDTHPEGWGYLQHQSGSTHYQEGINQLFNHQCDPQPYYDRALTSYKKALKTLIPEKFPKLRIETLIDIAKVYLAQHNTHAAHQCKTEAFEILQDLLNAQPTPEGKKRLQIEYHSLRHLDVDLFIVSSDNINALVAAELDKNNRLTWLLSALAETTISPAYAQMKQLLTTEQTGIVYWHLSPDNLTTFILMANDSQPLVWESDRRKQAQQLAKWIKEWDTQYRDYGSKKAAANQPTLNDEAAAKAKEQHPWRKNLPDYLAQLQQILEIDKICAQLPATLTHLFLIPHGDLHRFPLHTLFLASAKLPNLQSCTYLPSIQIGLNLQQRSSQTKSYAPLLSVEDPETHQDEMPFAQIESTIVRHLLQPNTHINSASADLATVEDALRQPHASFHFTGHAAYNSRSPETSALALTDEPLTAKRISQLDLSSYNLITLAACETAITGRENINTEYVGLSSAFLQAGAANVFSTLWQVDEIASTWFTIYFYQQLLSGKSPAVALTITQRWLQTVTWQELADWLDRFSSLKIVKLYVDKEILEKEGKIGLDRTTKYSHPYYWAAFTLTGQG